MSTPAFDRLPRWARHEIQRLTADLASAEAKIQKGAGAKFAYTEPGPTNTSHEADRHMQRSLPDGTRVRFTVAGTVVEAWVDSQGLLNVYGRGALLVRPRSSNVIQVIGRDR